MPPHRQSQLNTILIVLSILVAVTALAGTAWAVHRYLSPFEAVLPKIDKIEAKIEKQGSDLTDIAMVQHSQTKVLEALADVATKSVRLEMHVEKHDEEIGELKQSIKELESRTP